MILISFVPDFFQMKSLQTKKVGGIHGVRIYDVFLLKKWRDITENIILRNGQSVLTILSKKYFRLTTLTFHIMKNDHLPYHYEKPQTKH
ncbi:hypothetical protein Xbed_01651 [Xenorhabdus beddingii]|uniref:Uncharacterized protein n=1 Tax=Xenorhabdus beddingii TaxID=40578 RepID=A0A1Y2SPN2_9GAMM|nr:hypothetical protein Xbed_01651 [Xenorhabdus beddingii]